MTVKPPLLNEKFEHAKCAVLIPTYNNERTLKKVIEDSLLYTNHILVVNDGANDGTAKILSHYAEQITIITHPQNLGKGLALRNGFNKALEMGYHYVITIDSDGQHFPEDFEHFLDKLVHHPDSLIIGARNMNSENVPGGSSFGNKFSNFWYRVETGITLPDTQSGYRLYPIHKMRKITYFTSRFEFEIEAIVKAAWKGIPIISMPVKIFYAPAAERISHFRKNKDFARISLLNAYLVILAFCWYTPMRFFKGLTPKNIKSFIVKHFFSEQETILHKSSSVALGIFFGIVPIWGYQLISAIAAAYLLKLNRAIVILSANISFPPFIPFILIASLQMGELVTGDEAHITLSNISLENMKTNLFTYLVGATVLAVSMALFMGLFTFLTLTLLSKRNKSVS
ncbi:MAG: DUF2062 domain-containing protein [bacterium]|nr:DUF2062 domain-containing protein [bacterium]